MTFEASREPDALAPKHRPGKRKALAVQRKPAVREGSVEHPQQQQSA